MEIKMGMHGFAFDFGKIIWMATIEQNWLTSTDLLNYDSFKKNDFEWIFWNLCECEQFCAKNSWIHNEWIEYFAIISLFCVDIVRSFNWIVTLFEFQLRWTKIPFVLLFSLRNNFHLRIMHTRKSIEFLFFEQIKLLNSTFAKWIFITVHTKRDWWNRLRAKVHWNNF